MHDKEISSLRFNSLFCLIQGSVDYSSSKDDQFGATEPWLYSKQIFFMKKFFHLTIANFHEFIVSSFGRVRRTGRLPDRTYRLTDYGPCI